MTEQPRDWRLTPKEQLFEPPRRDGSASLPPSVNISDDIMRNLARGRRIDEGRLLVLADILAESILSDDSHPLSGFADLIEALHADYAYYDADKHLEGFSEGVVYGMTRLAEAVVKTLGQRSERFLPPSALLHPDVLVTASEDRTTDADRLCSRLGLPERQILSAIVFLQAERLIGCTIWGMSRHYYLTRKGADCADRIGKMASECMESSAGDPERATDLMMGQSDFASRDAVRRAIAVVSGHACPTGKDAGDSKGTDGARANAKRTREEKRLAKREASRNEAIGRLWNSWIRKGSDGKPSLVITQVGKDGSETSRPIGSCADLSNQELVALLCLQKVMTEHELASDSTEFSAKVTVTGSCGLNAYEDRILCELNSATGGGGTTRIRMAVSGDAMPSHDKALDDEAYIDETSIDVVQRSVTTMQDTATDTQSAGEIQARIESLLARCIGSDDFLEDEDHENLNLVSEYQLDMNSFVEIVSSLNEEFGLGVSPTQIEWSDIDTIEKIVHLVETREK